MKNSEKVPYVLSQLQRQLDAIDSYLCTWFTQLPLEGMEEVMGNYNAPDREDYTATQEGEDEYQYDLAQYIDSLYRDFSEVSLDIKTNDFRVYANRYADTMAPTWDFIGYADFVN